MAWAPADEAAWKKQVDALPSTARSDGGGPNPASSNPPLYYLTAAVAYVISGGSFFSALFAERVVSVLWIMVAVLGTWLLAGECSRRNRLVQVGAAGTVALLPMVSFLAGAVGPDSALFATWSLVMWLGVRLIRHGRPWPDAVALGLAAGASCVVKATGYALIPAVLLAAFIAWRRAGGRTPRALLASVGGLVAIVGVWFVIAAITGHAAAAQVGDVTTGSTTPFNLRQFLSYVWQFYLPRVPGQTVAVGLPPGGLPVYEVWLKGAWGRFGWLEITYAERVYTLATIVTIAVSVLALVRLIQRRHSVDFGVVAFLALLILALLGGVHWTDYHQIVGGASFAQGRYLLPLVPIVGLVIAYAIRLVPAGHRGVATAGVLGSLVVLQLFSLVEVLERFYA
jgi:4-amino-4-deoxy-L-arabinose transferase-like glycosyltransferase